MNITRIPDELRAGALLHFQSGVPIDDVAIKPSQRRRLARVHHVYWIWIKNPFLDTFAMFRQLCSQEHYADRSAEWVAAKKDDELLKFIIDNVKHSSRQEDEAKVRAAAEQAIRIGMETDNVVALTKGGKLLYDVAGLDKPESDQADMSKVMFLPPVVTTQVTDVDPNKTPVTDEQALAIINKYDAHQDSKRLAIEERVNTMMAKRDANEITNEERNDG